jgi:hypothetical protein
MTFKNEPSPDLQPNLVELITLREAADLSGLSHSHLRLLIRRGDIWGMKKGRDWFTTAHAVGEYLALNRHPGPKSKKALDHES